MPTCRAGSRAVLPGGEMRSVVGDAGKVFRNCWFGDALDTVL